MRLKQHYQKTFLDNGLTVVSENMPFVRSVAIGVWIQAGTRLEEKQSNGVAHFLEHMMFKETRQRSAREIVRSLESLGGNLNAFTSREQTCYYAEILDEHVDKTVEVLADILWRSEFIAADFEKERGVILDEIYATDEMPDEMVQDLFMERLFPNHGLGYPILGTRETVKQMTRDDLMHFYHRHYCAANIVVAAAGNIEHERLLELCEQYFKFRKGDKYPCNGVLETPGAEKHVVAKPVQQAHICIGAAGYPYGHPRRYELLLLNTLLSGGMGSRLFQNIRERYGLAYSIYSFVDFYIDNGSVGIYLATDKRNLSQAEALLEQELEKLRKAPIGQQELDEAKSQLKGSMILGAESSSRRMNRLATTEIYLGAFQEIEEVIEKMNQVTRENLWETVRDIWNGEKIVKVIFVPKNKRG